MGLLAVCGALLQTKHARLAETICCENFEATEQNDENPEPNLTAISHKVGSHRSDAVERLWSCRPGD
jgi:hypothetical protein